MLSVRGDDKLKAVTLALRNARRDVRSTIDKATRSTLNPVWRDLVESKARTAQDRAVLGKGARITGGNPPTLVAASSKRKVSGGLVPAEQWHAVEFGADRNAVTTYTRTSVRGVRHQVKRHTRRGLPARRPRGRVLMPGVADLSPRAAALWSQIVVRTFADAMEAGD